MSHSKNLYSTYLLDFVYPPSGNHANITNYHIQKQNYILIPVGGHDDKKNWWCKLCYASWYHIQFAQLDAKNPFA